MELVSVRLITADIRRLAAFYAAITEIAPVWSTDDFAEITTAAGTLAIGSERTMQFFGGDIARAADNQSAIVEFRVADVDAVYDRCKAALGAALVQPPTTMPWGNRSLLVRDPDGTLVNLFTPIEG